MTTGNYSVTFNFTFRFQIKFFKFKHLFVADNILVDVIDVCFFRVVSFFLEIKKFLFVLPFFINSLKFILKKMSETRAGAEVFFRV